MIYSQSQLKINSILQSIFRTNSVFLAVFLLLSVHSNNANTNSPLLSLDDQTLHSIYYKNLVTPGDWVVLYATGNDTIEKLQSNLNNAYQAKAIEIAGYNRLFRRCENESMIACDLVEVFFSQGYEPDMQKKLEEDFKSGEVKFENFQLECLNLTSNGLTENFLDINRQSKYAVKHSLNYSSLYSRLVEEYFCHLRILKLTGNKLKHLEKKHFDLFKGTYNRSSSLEAIFLDSNLIRSIRHDTFYNLKHLKYLDLSNNKLKIIHPLTFSVCDSQLTLLNLANNRLRAVFYTPLYKKTNIEESNQTNTTSIEQTNKTSPLPNLRFLYLHGNRDLSCDCGLLWLFYERHAVTYDNFTCNFISPVDRVRFNLTVQSEVVLFNSIRNESFLWQVCPHPNMHVDESSLEQTSSFTLFRGWSNRWFDWTLLVDQLPETTSYPYMMSDEKREEIESNYEGFNKYIDYLNRNETEQTNGTLEQQEKHVFHTWRTSDVVFDCTNTDTEGKDSSNSTIIWKTQHGYFSFLDKDLTDSLNSYMNEELGIEENDSNNSVPFNQEFRNSFKIFYQMNRLIKIRNNLTVRIGEKFGGESYSNYLVNEYNQLIVTNMRQIVAGPFVCIAINEQGIKTYEYDIHVRVGIDEYFIYCLFVSIISGFVPSIISLVICCVCEYKAARDYNIIRHYTCHPTPMTGTTPPNFDFNDWVANAASYLPNLKIHDTLDQVSKKLRKGMGKASVAVKTLGITSSTYIYSVYETSTQRWSDMKGYVPTLNVPSLNMRTIKYPPMGQIANRMRMGMGNMLFQVKEFCGSSDLNHTVSIGDLDLETNASKAVGGQEFILDKINQKHCENERQRQNQFQNFLNFLREESRNVNRKKRPANHSITIKEDEEYPKDNAQASQPTTSAQAMASSDYLDAPTVVVLPKLNMMITFSNVNDDIQKIEQFGNEDDEDDDDDYVGDECKINEIPGDLDEESKVKGKSTKTDIPFIDTEAQQ